MVEVLEAFEQICRTCQLKKCLFEIGCLGSRQQTGHGIECRELALVDHRNSMRELFNFRERVRSEEQGSSCATQNFLRQKTPEFRRGNGVQTAP